MKNPSEQLSLTTGYTDYKTDYKIEIEQEDHRRQAKLIQGFCIVAGLAFFNSGVLLLGVGFFLGSLGAYIGVGIFAGVVGLIIGSYRLAKQMRVRESCFLLVSVYLCLTVFTYWLVGMVGAIIVFQFAAVGASLIILSTREVIFIAISSLAIGIITFVLENYLKLFSPLIEINTDLENFLNLALFFVGVPAALAILVIPSRYRIETIYRRNNQLQTALQQLQSRQNVSQDVSQAVLNLSVQLENEANQWSESNKQQVLTLMQVRTSVMELSATSASITSLTEKVSQAASLVARDSQIIEETAQNSFSQSETGQEAVKRSSTVSNEVASFYQELLTSMQDLQKQGENMRLILGLIKDVSDETHLLALNAAIEAAGAGEYGERFAVVAQEIKNLAKRSADATKQVVEIIAKVENAGRQSLEVAETGVERTHQLEDSSQQANQSILEMHSLAEQIREQATLIARAIGEVRDLSFVIRDATVQQKIASQQVMQALDNLNLISQKSTAGSRTITGSASKLTELSENLKTTLTN